MVLLSKLNLKLPVNHITSTQCYNAVTDTLTKHLPININGSLTVKQFFTQLVCLATHKESIHSSSKLFPNYLSETALRHHLKKFNMDMLIAASSELLFEYAKPHLIPGNKYECAIDFTGDPYYGDIDENNEKYIVKGQRKKSTYKFYTYATLSIVEKNEKFTLAVLPVEKGYVTVQYVSKLLEVLDKYQITPEVIYMDGGFYTVDVMKFLVDKKIPFIIPAPNRHGKLRQLINNTKKQQKYEYFVGEGGKNRTKVTLGILAKRPKKIGKERKNRLSYVIYGLDNWPLNKVARKYIHRFSIEATYRIRNEIKPKTSTKNAVIRYLFALISFLIENVWVSFQITFFTRKQRGPKMIEEDRFPLSLFLMLINEKLRTILKYRRVVMINT